LDGARSAGALADIRSYELVEKVLDMVARMNRRDFLRGVCAAALAPAMPDIVRSPLSFGPVRIPNFSCALSYMDAEAMWSAAFEGVQLLEFTVRTKAGELTELRITSVDKPGRLICELQL